MKDSELGELYGAAARLAASHRAWHPDGRAEELALAVVDLVKDAAWVEVERLRPVADAAAVVSAAHPDIQSPAMHALRDALDEAAEGGLS